MNLMLQPWIDRPGHRRMRTFRVAAYTGPSLEGKKEQEQQRGLLTAKNKTSGSGQEIDLEMAATCVACA